MGIRDFFKKPSNEPRVEPRVMAASDGGRLITTPEELEAALRGVETSSGVVVTTGNALTVPAAFACIRLISAAVTNVPLHVKRRVDGDIRADASDTALWKLLRRRPNKHMTARQFRRALQVDVLSEHGNGYAHIVRGVFGEPIQLIRLEPGRVEVKQRKDLSKEFVYSRKDGSKVTFPQQDVFHLFGLTLDGIRGVGPIRYARETLGGAITMASHGSKMFQNGARHTGALETDKTLGAEGISNLRESLQTFRAGGENEGKDMILEDGLKYNPISLSAVDAQWIEARAFSRGDVAMFYGVPPHMIGVTEKTTSWGSGIEEQTLGFLTYTLEDHFTMWEDAIDAHLTEDEDDLYARFNRAALVRTDVQRRGEYYSRMLQWGVMSPNEIRALEDLNPRDGGEVFYDPPNTAGTPGSKGDKT